VLVSRSTRGWWAYAPSTWRDGGRVGPTVSVAADIVAFVREDIAERGGTPKSGDTTNVAGITHADRVRLESVRYATVPEAAEYLAIMRTFTSEISGLLSDQSASEVATRLTEQGIELDTDTADARLSYLVEHGNLARSPRESEAHSVREYLQSRSRYQLTQIGELVHRQIEELLGTVEQAREVSSEMLGGMLTGLTKLDGYDEISLAGADPEELAGEIGTVFAQFERLVESTRDFYTYLSQVLVRFDLDRGEFQAFKTALLDYLQRFVDDIARHMPQLADVLTRLEPRVDKLCDRANEGGRLLSLDGTAARRSRGLDPADWDGLTAWFVGSGRRESDAAGVRRLATDAMKALLVNLRRIASNAEREQSRYGDLLELARWFDQADDDTAHALWASAFGLYPCRHLGVVADDAGDPVPATASWWRSPVADVPVTLRQHGQRTMKGRSGKREDFSAAKRARVAQREAAEQRRREALAELARHAGELDSVRVSDEARAVLLDLYSRALTGHGRPLKDGAAAVAATDGLRFSVGRTPGRSTVVTSPAGRIEVVDLTISIAPAVSNDAASTIGAAVSSNGAAPSIGRTSGNDDAAAAHVRVVASA
jgi:uncharacterized protein (TIGR02677 family)